ncbi:MAG: nuclease [Methanosarcinales archaeon]|nr:nuclease [Methanosarcinales archaeon]
MEGVTFSMVEKTVENPFDELPEALVEEMLNQCDELGENLSKSFRKLYEKKNDFRRKLIEQKLLKNDAEISSAPTHPTTCGVDGSYAIEKLLSTDMTAIAGVAVEGLAPPTEKRYWPKPHHLSEILTTPHSDSTTVVARAIMMCMELDLAAKAPHDVIFLDGSLTTPFIYFNQALNKADEVSDSLSSLLHERLKIALESYKEILLSKRTDKMFVGMPKYTTRREITQKILKIDGYEDRGFLSSVLDAGEFVGPVEIQEPPSRWHIDRQPANLKSIISEIIDALGNLFVVYYRPYNHFPALRMEISQSVRTNMQRLAILFESLRLQCGAPGVMEPYPLYLADRMVKHLRTALPAIRKTTTQEMSLKWEDSLGNIYLAMHGYRTEWGK